MVWQHRGAVREWTLIVRLEPDAYYLRRKVELGRLSDDRHFVTRETTIAFASIFDPQRATRPEIDPYKLPNGEILTSDAE